METKEFNFKGFKTNGFLMLFLMLILLAGIVWLYSSLEVWGIITGIVMTIIWIILFPGYTKLDPNEAIVMIFFGKYKGVLKETGFFWVNPFMTKKKLSMRARNLNADPIKVNDKVGNPAEGYLQGDVRNRRADNGRFKAWKGWCDYLYGKQADGCL